jgi:hypothetical protein
VVYFEPQFPVELRVTDEEGQPLSIKELYTLRILGTSSSEGPYEIKVELSSE